MIYFMLSGKANYVLPSYDNIGYIDIETGDHIGVIDIIGSAMTHNVSLNNWFDHKNLLHRQFTTMALDNVEMLMLSINDLIRIQKEFPDYYKNLFQTAFYELRSAWVLRLRAMKECRVQYIQQDFQKLEENKELLEDENKKYKVII